MVLISQLCKLKAACQRLCQCRLMHRQNANHYAFVADHQSHLTLWSLNSENHIWQTYQYKEVKNQCPTIRSLTTTTGTCNITQDTNHFVAHNQVPASFSTLKFKRLPYPDLRSSHHPPHPASSKKHHPAHQGYSKKEEHAKPKSP